MIISVDEAVERLLAGQVIAIPTETVYGLAASTESIAAVDQIFALKGRPSNNPLIIHLAKASQVLDFVHELPPDFDELAKAFWPGPLTIVMPVNTHKVLDRIRAGLPTAAFRIPDHKLARSVLLQAGPLVMPSANLSGKPSSTTVHHVENDFGKTFPVLDGGACRHGVESTILCWGPDNKWVIIRLGAISPSDFKPVLGYMPEVVIAGKEEITPICPGQLHRHYAPAAVLHLTTSFEQSPLSAIVGFEGRKYPKHDRFYSFGNDDPSTALERLYAILRQIDQDGVSEAFVDVDFPKSGLWLTLKERLIKAAHGRS
jgi:L-threonylcarbamoyladenylate synthase